MKTFFGIIVVFGFLYLFYLPAAYLSYARAESEAFTAEHLDMALDYAGEAAMLSCLLGDNLELDYTDDTEITLSPSGAPEAFAAMLCINYGWPVTDSNLQYVLSCVPVMALAVNDGYHLAEHSEDSEYTTALLWQIKRPYIIDTEPLAPNLGTAYAVELEGNHWSAANKSTLTISEGNSYSALPFTREQALQQINLTIDTAINGALHRFALSRGADERQIFNLPLSQGATGVRRIERPTLLLVLQDFSPGGGKKYSLSVVSGVSTAAVKPIGAWYDTSGSPWYAHVDDIPGVAVVHFYDRAEDAAREGFYPWMD